VSRRSNKVPATPVLRALEERVQRQRSDLGVLLQSLGYFVGDVERFLIAKDKGDKEQESHEVANMRCRLGVLKVELAGTKGKQG